LKKRLAFMVVCVAKSSGVTPYNAASVSTTTTKVHGSLPAVLCGIMRVAAEFMVRILLKAHCPQRCDGIDGIYDNN
jgi:hypothetical protein